MWVRFTQDFDWKPTPAVTIAYKAGMIQNVTRACAAEAEAKGKAMPVSKASKDVSE